MRADYSIKVCDICKERIYDDSCFIERNYGPITLYIPRTVHDEYGYESNASVPNEFKDVCENCRRKISNFVMENLYKKDYPGFEVTFNNKEVEAIEGEE